jgi:hypothetical protein
MPRLAILKTLNTRTELSTDEPIDALVNEWDLVLQDHEAWSKSKNTRLDLAKTSVEHLKRFGLDVSDAALRKMSNAGLIEVELPVTTGDWSWKLPWEFLLTSATTRFRSRSQDLLVIRCLDETQRRDGSATLPPTRLLVFKSNPDYLSNLYSDNSLRYEEINVAGNIGLKLEPGLNSHNLTLAELKKTLNDYRPDVLHFAGIDSIQGMEFKYSGTKVPLKDIPEGMMINTPEDTATIAKSEELVDTICNCKEHLPRLVAFNLSMSSSIAGLAVANGAQSAIGFYRNIDDMVAECFYTNFYLAWRLSQWNLLDAFRMAWSEVLVDAPMDKLWGSGIVLWTASSLLEREKRRRNELGISASVSGPPLEVKDAFEKETAVSLQVKPITKGIRVLIKQLPELNYCLLHNNRDLFKWFYIRKLVPEGVFENITVEVSLYVGHEKLTFRTRKELRYPIWDLIGAVRVPLTASLPRALRESIFTGLHVKVEASEQPIFEDTFRVNLLPIDQWVDDDQNRQWLPSFVLPRDPVILNVVDVAQKYLAAISDNPTAGFDSYHDKSAIDLQVRALWSALLNDFSLSYIVPPPSFQRKGQRLRSPSETIKGRRGTCIDLALLFASVLEYVEIYPVVFLFAGHAFAGYYRNAEAHEQIRTYVLKHASKDSDFWMLGKDVHQTIQSLLDSNSLVALETEGLARKLSFQAAVARGRKELAEKLANFEFLVDIRMAREGGVTPLPL